MNDWCRNQFEVQYELQQQLKQQQAQLQKAERQFTFFFESAANMKETQKTLSDLHMDVWRGERHIKTLAWKVKELEAREGKAKELEEKVKELEATVKEEKVKELEAKVKELENKSREDLADLEVRNKMLVKALDGEASLLRSLREDCNRILSKE